MKKQLGMTLIEFSAAIALGSAFILPGIAYIGDKWDDATIGMQATDIVMDNKCQVSDEVYSDIVASSNAIRIKRKPKNDTNLCTNE